MYDKIESHCEVRSNLLYLSKLVNFNFIVTIRGVILDLNRAFLTFFYVGTIKKAPGTFGSLAAIPFALLILEFLHPSNLFFLSLLLAVVSIKAIDEYEKRGGVHDAKEIVIDEVAGMWLALSLIGEPGVLGVVLAFIFFRILDIKKPSYIGKIDREVSGGKGVVLDDLLAGVFAGILAALSIMVIEFFI